MKITLTVNGERKTLNVRTNQTLLHVLREELGLTGAKEGCGTGDCGACTVVLDGRAVNSCLILAVDADGGHILTVEGLFKEGKLHPLQKAFVDEHAVQCGYCIPGVLMTSLAYLGENPEPTKEEVTRAISGNICRCGGYQFMVGAISDASKQLKGR